MKTEVGFSFEYEFKGVEAMNDIQATCYPSLHAQISDIFQLRGDTSLVPTELKLRFLVNTKEALTATLEIYGNVVSDAYKLDSSLDDKQYSHKMFVIFEPPPPGSN